MTATPVRAATTPMRQLVQYLEIPLRRPFHVVVPLVAIMLAAWLAASMVPKKYRSSTLLVLQWQNVPLANTFIPKTPSDAGPPSKRLASLTQQVVSRPRLETVIRELDPYPALRNRPLSSVVERLGADIDVHITGPDSFTIEYVHTDPSKAKAVVDRLARLLIKESAETRTGQVAGASDVIDARVADLQLDLDAIEDRTRLFKERNMGRLPEQMAANLAALQRLLQQQQALEESLRAAVQRERQLENALGSGDQPKPSELNQLRAQLLDLRSRYTDEHPDVRALITRIARLEKIAAQTPATAPPANDSELGNARAEIAGLKDRLNDVERNMAMFQSRVDAAPRVEQELATLTRDYERVKETYLALLKQKMDAEMAARLEARFTGDQLRVLDPGYLPDQPYSPNKRLFLLAGLLLGLAAGLGLAVAAEMLDPSIKSPTDLELLMPYPILARLPRIPSRNRWGTAKLSPAPRRPLARIVAGRPRSTRREQGGRP